jgi:hypothetical protein
MGVVELVCVEEARSGEGCVFSVYNKGIRGVFQVVCGRGMMGVRRRRRRRRSGTVTIGCLACRVHCLSASRSDQALSVWPCRGPWGRSLGSPNPHLFYCRRNGLW